METVLDIQPHLSTIKTPSLDTKALTQFGREVIDIEAQAILALKPRINQDFATACHYLLQCKGRIIVTGMGKSGHIAKKIAATLASTGSPAFFVHPGEAGHGDMGMITPQDVVIAISNSGKTQEVITLLPLLKRMGVVLISLTGNPKSALAKDSHVHLDISVEKEACPLGLAPTSSTTAALVMGDALAITLLQARGFTADDFARSHPGGNLGKRLLLHIDDIMHKGESIPIVTSGTLVNQALLKMTEKGLGMTAIVDTENRLLGIFTDGDLRRALDLTIDIHSTSIDSVMTKNPKTMKANKLAVEALHLMQTHKINGFFVTDENGTVTGAFNTHDLLRAGVY